MEGLRLKRKEGTKKEGKPLCYLGTSPNLSLASKAARGTILSFVYEMWASGSEKELGKCLATLASHSGISSSTDVAIIYMVTGFILNPNHKKETVE